MQEDHRRGARLNEAWWRNPERNRLLADITALQEKAQNPIR
jgi:hypothetical protein